MKHPAVKIFISFYKQAATVCEFYSFNTLNEQISKFYS